MRITTIIDEDTISYQFPSMYIGMGEQDSFAISDDEIVTRYRCSDTTVAIVIGGDEPLDQFEEVFNFISKLRFDYHCNSRVIIYTNYDRDEVTKQINALKMLDPIIVKFGRYIPGQEPHLDPVLGVKLASDNQYATWIS